MSRVYEMTAGAVIDAEGRTVVNGVVSIYDAETGGNLIAPATLRQADGSAWPIEGVKTDGNGKVKALWPDAAGAEPDRLYVDTMRGRWPMVPADLSARLVQLEESGTGGLTDDQAAAVANAASVTLVTKAAARVIDVPNAAGMAGLGYVHDPATYQLDTSGVNKPLMGHPVSGSTLTAPDATAALATLFAAVQPRDILDFGGKTFRVAGAMPGLTDKPGVRFQNGGLAATATGSTRTSLWLTRCHDVEARDDFWLAGRDLSARSLDDAGQSLLRFRECAGYGGTWRVIGAKSVGVSHSRSTGPDVKLYASITRADGSHARDAVSYGYIEVWGAQNGDDASSGVAYRQIDDGAGLVDIDPIRGVEFRIHATGGASVRSYWTESDGTTPIAGGRMGGFLGIQGCRIFLDGQDSAGAGLLIGQETIEGQWSSHPARDNTVLAGSRIVRPVSNPGVGHAAVMAVSSEAGGHDGLTITDLTVVLPTQPDRSVLGHLSVQGDVHRMLAERWTVYDPGNNHRTSVHHTTSPAGFAFRDSIRIVGTPGSSASPTALPDLGVYAATAPVERVLTRAGTGGLLDDAFQINGTLSYSSGSLIRNNDGTTTPAVVVWDAGATDYRLTLDVQNDEGAEGLCLRATSSEVITWTGTTVKRSTFTGGSATTLLSGLPTIGDGTDITAVSVGGSCWLYRAGVYVGRFDWPAAFAAATRVGQVVTTGWLGALQIDAGGQIPLPLDGLGGGVTPDDVTDITDPRYVGIASAITLTWGASSATLSGGGYQAVISGLTVTPTSGGGGGGGGPTATTILDPDGLTGGNGTSITTVPNTGVDGVDAVMSPGDTGGAFLSKVNTGTLSGHKAVDTFNQQIRLVPPSGINTLTGCGFVAVYDREVVTGDDWPLFLLSGATGPDASVNLPSAFVTAHYDAGGMQLWLGAGTGAHTSSFVTSTGIPWDSSSGGGHAGVNDIAEGTFMVSVLFAPSGVVRVNQTQVAARDLSQAGSAPTIAAIGGNTEDGTGYRGGFALLGAEAKWSGCTLSDLQAMETHLAARLGL